MREIKFRAWVLEEEEMYYSPDMEDWNGFDAWLRIDCEDNDISVGSVKLMQYTGLKDKNGKEIYEGDLIQVSDIGIAEVVYGFHVTSKDDWSVEHRTMGFTLKWTGTDDHSELHSPEEYEIIGNIYENPELLDK